MTHKILEIAMLVICNAGILAVWILATISALSTGSNDPQSKRKRGEVE